MLYENFHYLAFARHSSGKSRSSICVQDSVKPTLHNQINLYHIINLISLTEAATGGVL